LKFTLSQTRGLLSDNFQGYAVDQHYRSNKLVPINRFNRVNCLVLKKFDHDLQFSKGHEYVLLVPDTQIILDEAKPASLINPI
jgi:hypothetical protein